MVLYPNDSKIKKKTNFINKKLKLESKSFKKKYILVLEIIFFTVLDLVLLKLQNKLNQ